MGEVENEPLEWFRRCCDSEVFVSEGSVITEMGGGTSASLDWDWVDSFSGEGLGESVTMTGGKPRALDGVSLGEADREDVESTDGEDDLEEVFSARASSSSSLSSSMFSCLTDSASTSIAMPSPSVEVERLAVSEPSASSMEMLNPLALAASTVFARTEFCSVRNLMCATAPRKTLTR